MLFAIKEKIKITDLLRPQKVQVYVFLMDINNISNLNLQLHEERIANSRPGMVYVYVILNIV